MFEPLLHPDEVARRLGISRRTLRRFTSAGEIPAVRITRRIVRYRRVDIERWLEGHIGNLLDLPGRFALDRPVPATRGKSGQFDP